MSEKLKNPRTSIGKKDMVNKKSVEKINPELEKNRWFLWFGAPLVFVIFLWSYWPTIVEIWKVWMRSDEYSSGLLVPILAVYIAWSVQANCPMSNKTIVVGAAHLYCRHGDEISRFVSLV